jgi:hypothetical protein
MKKSLKWLAYAFVGFFIFLFILGWFVRPKVPTELEKAQQFSKDSLDRLRREVEEREQDSLKKT